MGGPPGAGGEGGASGAFRHAENTKTPPLDRAVEYSAPAVEGPAGDRDTQSMTERLVGQRHAIRYFRVVTAGMPKKQRGATAKWSAPDQLNRVALVLQQAGQPVAVVPLDLNRAGFYRATGAATTLQPPGQFR